MDYARILSGPIESMPRGSEYFGSGLYFIADSRGKDIMLGQWFFHPVFDADKNSSGGRYVVTSASDHVSRCMSAIESAKPKLAAEISRLENFLAKIMRACPAIPKEGEGGALAKA